MAHRVKGDSNSQEKPYPAAWEARADLRVFRADAKEWDRLIQWRADMRRRGWKLLQVTGDGDELVAVFGRSRAQ